MPILNITMARSMPTATSMHYFTASQQLMDTLLKHRFVELVDIGGITMRKGQHYQAGENYFFRKHGQCTVHFLKDGRVHVLYGPIALWNLHDMLNHEELRVLLAFASMCEEHQECMRNYLVAQLFSR